MRAADKMSNRNLAPAAGLAPQQGDSMSNFKIGAARLRAALLCSAGLMAMATTAAVAQPATTNGQVESVTVTGLIGSLQRNLDIKRDAGGLVDAISAEDIGKFPDVDIAAAMQRIPGVTITRGASRSAACRPRPVTPPRSRCAASARPSTRPCSTAARSPAASGRAFDFSSIGADFISQVDILKSPDATLSSGAIGATVNLKFPNPFDHPGLEFVATGGGSYFAGRGQYHAQRRCPVQRHLRQRHLRHPARCVLFASTARGAITSTSRAGKAPRSTRPSWRCGARRLDHQQHQCLVHPGLRPLSGNHAGHPHERPGLAAVAAGRESADHGG